VCRVWLSRPGVVAGAALSFQEMIPTGIESVKTWTPTGWSEETMGSIVIAQNKRDAKD